MAGGKKKSFRDVKSPYQFYIPTALKKEAVEIAEDNAIPLAPFMIMAIERFVKRPPEESQRILRAYRRRVRREKKLKKGVTIKL